MCELDPETTERITRLADSTPQLTSAQLVEFVERFLDTMPRPTDKQLDKVAAMLRTGSGASLDAATKAGAR